MLKFYKHIFLYPLFLTGISLLIIRCGDAADSGPVALPSTLVIDCQIPQCNSSTVSQSSALVLVSDTQGGCSSNFKILASSTVAISCDASQCSSVSSPDWRSDGEPISEIPEGLFDLCIHIDNTETSLEPTAGDILFTSSKFFSGSDSVTADGNDWVFLAGAE